MIHATLLVVHVGAAAIALLTGFAALLTRKGLRSHRRSGNVYAVCMLIMGATALVLGLLTSSTLDVLVAAMALYLVAGGWLTVKQPANQIGALEYLLALAALSIAAVATDFAWQAAQSPTGDLRGLPAGAYVGFGTVALFGFGMDARMLIRGGIEGKHRVARHLWRLCLALLFTAVAFFLPTRFELPAFLTRGHLNVLPVIFVALSTLYWLVRVLRNPAGIRKYPSSSNSPCAAKAMTAAGIAPVKIVGTSFNDRPDTMGAP